MADSLVERTLVLLKPDSVTRGLIGRVLQRFEDAMLTIVGMKTCFMSDELAALHYDDLAERRGDDVYARTVAMMQESPIVAVALEGYEAVRVVRKLVGNTFPSEADLGSIRGDFAYVSGPGSSESGKAIANLVHASGTSDEAVREIAIWFEEAELFSYRPLAVQRFM
jgi:nucleoside-diphosphate kinase